MEFIQWRKTQHGNARKDIDLIQKEMMKMQKFGGDRNWEKWKLSKYLLDDAYKIEEEFWFRKSRIDTMAQSGG